MFPHPIRGVIFDLDGTLVDSQLDFEAMRQEMGLRAGAPLLEAITALPQAEQTRCRAILARHEAAGAERATLLPGVGEFLQQVSQAGLPKAVLTRNARATAQRTLARLELEIDLLVAREDAPAKPDPQGVLLICARWNLLPQQVLMVGDYLFDMQAGRAAGACTLLYTQQRPPEGLPGYSLADAHLRCFTQAQGLLAALCNCP